MRKVTAPSLYQICLRSFLCALLVAIFASNSAAADATNTSTNGTNMVVTGQLAGLAQSAAKVGTEAELPAKLTGLLWPSPGAPQKRTVQKLALAGREKGEERIFCVRGDNHDIVLAHFSVNTPDAASKVRREFYYRTTSQGDLTLALSATFKFTIDDVDNEILKGVDWQTYGAVTGDGTKPLPLTPEVRSDFEAEKKAWLAQEKKFAKQRAKKKE